MLNNKQKEVVDTKGSLVNIAGPGSGKTHTLISKIASIVLTDKSIINNILVLTFTNAAANEIKERSLKNIDIDNKRSLYFGTYHSTFKRLMKEEKVFENLYLGENPTLTTPNEISRFLTNQIKNDFMDNFKETVEYSIKNYYISNDLEFPKNLVFNKTILKKELIDANSILQSIDNQINYFKIEDIKKCNSIKEVYNLIKERTIIDLMNELKDGFTKTEEMMLKYKENKIKDPYSKEKEPFYYTKTFGATTYLSLIRDKEEKFEFPMDFNKDDVKKSLGEFMDDLFDNKFEQQIISFGDIMLLTLYSLVNFDDFRNNIQDKFKYIFVDEFQDTNVIQDEILFLMYKKDNICVIGDPYQSIYKFLGANIENIMNAKNRYSANTVQLVENYRSNQNIVDLTNYLGENMIEDISGWQPCVSSNKDVKNVPIDLLKNMSKEEQADYVVKKIKELPSGTKVGILNRNGNVYLLESGLTKSKLKYDKLGGLSLGESIEVKLFIHLFLYSMNYKKLDSLLYVLGSLSGIGAKSIEGYEKNIKKQMKDETHKFKVPAKILSAIEEIQNIVGQDISSEDYSYFLSNDELLGINKKIYEFYKLNMLPNISKNWKTSREREAKDKLKILFEEIKEQSTVIEVLSLLEEYINGSKEKTTEEYKNNITVTTIHSSKGLEWDVVFLMNWDNGSFERDDSKEAQRLVYVSVSRAKEKLIIMSQTNKFFNIDDEFIEENKIFNVLKLEETKEEPKIWFGKHKGKKISEIPYSYLEWILTNQTDLMIKKMINVKVVDAISEMYNEN